MALIHTSSAAREHTSRTCFIGKVSASTDEKEPARRLLYAGDDHRVTMFLCIPPNKDSGVKQRNHTQFYYVISGSGRLQLGKDGKQIHRIGHTSVISINANIPHVIYNTSKDKKPLRLLTVYSASSSERAQKEKTQRPKKQIVQTDEQEERQEAEKEQKELKKSARARKTISYREEPEDEESVRKSDDDE